MCCTQNGINVNHRWNTFALMLVNIRMHHPHSCFRTGWITSGLKPLNKGTQVIRWLCWQFSREVQCTNLNQKYKSYSGMVQLLKCNCLGVSCGFAGFCSDYSSGMCLVGDRRCGIGGRAYRQKLHTTLFIRWLMSLRESGVLMVIGGIGGKANI